MPVKGFSLSNRPIVLWIHDLGSAHNHDAIVNPEMFPNFSDGQLLRIHCPPELEKDQENDLPYTEHVIVKGHAPDKESLAKQLQVKHLKIYTFLREMKAKPHFELSISKDLADRFNFRSRQEVNVELVS